MSYSGECFCGAVKLEATGEPEGMGYCHCTSCRSWSGGPVNAFTLWQPGMVTVIQGKEHLATYNKTEGSTRTYCSQCGGHLLTDHPGLGVVDVFSATLPGLTFQPGLHINYSETVLPMKDGLPKFADFPGAFGGSDQQVPE
ncbi:MAG: GFA family protein [Novosphingobium sp.]